MDHKFILKIAEKHKQAPKAIPRTLFLLLLSHLLPRGSVAGPCNFSMKSFVLPFWSSNERQWALELYKIGMYVMTVSGAGESGAKQKFPCFKSDFRERSQRLTMKISRHHLSGSLCKCSTALCVRDAFMRGKHHQETCWCIHMQRAHYHKYINIFYSSSYQILTIPFISPTKGTHVTRFHVMLKQSPTWSIGGKSVLVAPSKYNLYFLYIKTIFNPQYIRL